MSTTIIVRRKGEKERHVIVADEVKSKELKKLYQKEGNPVDYTGLKESGKVTQYDLIRKLFRLGLSIPEIATRLIELGVFPHVRNEKLSALRGTEEGEKEILKRAKARVKRDLTCPQYYLPYKANYERVAQEE